MKLKKRVEALERDQHSHVTIPMPDPAVHVWLPRSVRDLFAELGPWLITNDGAAPDYRTVPVGLVPFNAIMDACRASKAVHPPAPPSNTGARR